MKLGDAGAATRSVLVDRLTAVLPAYLAGTSVALVAQTVPLVGVALAFVSLLGTGRIDRFVSTVRSVDVSPTGATSDAAASRLADATMALLTPTTVALLVASAVGGLVAFLVARAVVGAAQVHTVVAALRGERPVVAGVRGASADAVSFLALGVLRGLALLAPTVALALVGLAVADSALLPLLALGVLLWLPVTVAIYVVFAFAPQAIVVDDVGVLGGIEHGAGFVRRNPGRVGAYFVVVFLLVATVGGAAFAFQVLGVGPLAQVVGAFALAPTLGVLKTALYLDTADVSVAGASDATGVGVDDATAGERGWGDEPTTGGEPGVVESVVAAFQRGWNELLAFVRDQAVLVVATLGLFAAGIAGGLAVARPYAMPFPESPTTNVFGAFPLDTFVSLTANNWLVAIATAFAGLGFGVPSAVNMLFNGALVGAVVGLGENPVDVAALVVPHGILEVPALAVSGALGLHLGVSTWSYVRGRASADDLASELVRAFYVLLGLLPVFIVAAFIEAFVTWWVASLV